MTTHQKITSILNKAGFKPSQVKWVTEDGIRSKVITNGYKVAQFNKSFIGIECCFCQDQIEALVKVLTDNGYQVKETYPSGGYLKVTIN